MTAGCNAPPYRGDQAFVFVHASQHDQSEAFTLIEHLARDGFRVYYVQAEADGEEPGKRLRACAALVALYSREAAADHQFRKLVTAAVLSGRPVLPVFLEELELSPGMGLQLAPGLRIDWDASGAVPEALGRSALPADARGAPNPAIRVGERAPRSRAHAAVPEQRVWPISAIVVDEEEILRQKGLQRDAARYHVAERAVSAAPQTPSAGSPPPDSAAPSPVRRTVIVGEQDAALPVGRTVIVGEQDGCAAARGRHGTVIIEEIPPVGVLLATGERVAGQYGMTRIGRSEACEIRIPEQTVSAVHLEAYSFSDADGGFRNTLVDCHSSNGTWIDGARMEGGAPVSVEDTACVRLGRSVHLFLAFGRRAQQLRERELLWSIERAETGETRVIWEEEVMLGRCDPFHDGLFDAPQISWEHARLRCAADGCTITDQSSNGTLVNGSRIARHSPVTLRDGDELTMGYRRYVLHAVALRDR